ncbi:hypothetical protein [Streptomyces sp. NPDC059631]|uniref:hypothetical protein n=1 Tax=unclassified Streptomyces TaxID=2593676 RepID=UPI00369C0943
MATQKITITVPEELMESIKERVDARGVSSYIAAAAAHQDAMDRLRELAERSRRPSRNVEAGIVELDAVPYPRPAHG